MDEAMSRLKRYAERCDQPAKGCRAVVLDRWEGGGTLRLAGLDPAFMPGQGDEVRCGKSKFLVEARAGDLVDVSGELPEGDAIELTLDTPQVALRHIRSLLADYESGKLVKVQRENLELLLGAMPVPDSSTGAECEVPAGMTESQADAIRKGIDRRYHLIVGPPGTGKTYVIGNLVDAAVANGQRVLLTAHTNLAVENMVRKVDKAGHSPVWVGRSEMMGQVKHASLEKRMEALGDRRLSDAETKFEECERKCLVVSEAASPNGHAVCCHNRENPFNPAPLIEAAGRGEAKGLVPMLARLVLGRRSHVAEAARGMTAGGGVVRSACVCASMANDERLAGVSDGEALEVAAIICDAANLDGARPLLDLPRKERWTALLDALRRKADEELAEARRARRERRLELARELVSKANVTASTVIYGGGDELKGSLFDVAIMDEASQVNSYLASLSLVRARRIVLVGDDKQLQPIESGADLGSLDESVFNNLKARGCTFTFLDTQFRMDPAIAEVASRLFYEGKYRSHESTAGKGNVARPPILDGLPPLCWLDTSGCGMHEQPGKGSMWNPKEAELVARLVAEFVDAGHRPADIGVITPYRGQANALLEVLPEGVESATVYRYQGREKPVILMSMVNSNPAGRGRPFVAEPAQVNVALTRGQCCTVVVGDLSTLRSLPLMAKLAEELGKGGVMAVGSV